MRAARVLLFAIIGTLATPVAAAPRKAAKSDFSDMFAGMEKAPARTSRHGHASPARHARSKSPKLAAKATAKAAPKLAAKPALVAEAAPRPQPAHDVLVLSDYAPDRHALVGP